MATQHLEYIKTQSHSITGSTIAHWQHLHALPELSFNEVNTSQYIANQLDSYGIEWHRVRNSTSIIGIIRGKGIGRTVGIRAELDALPLTELGNSEHASRNNGVMHACGHDIHMATLLSAGYILKELKEQLEGQVLLIFESGEEQLPGGANAILHSDFFNRHKPDAMLALHVLPELKAGQAGLAEGRYMASGDEIHLTVKGKGGHAALPHTLIDPVVMASSLILSLQQVISRNAPALIPSVLSFGKVVANGATNIIPDEVHIEGTFRTMDENWRSEAHKHIEQICLNTCRAAGGDCVVDIRSGYPAVFNNVGLTRQVRGLLSGYLGDANIATLEPRMTTDDFAFFSQAIPSVFFRIGVGFSDTPPYQLHSPTFKANGEALRSSPGLLAWVVMGLLDSSCKTFETVPN